MTVRASSASGSAITPSSVSVPSGGTIDLYNLGGPGTTDYERLRLNWLANIAYIFTQNDGAGNARQLRIGSSGTDGATQPDLAHTTWGTGAPYIVNAFTSHQAAAIAYDAFTGVIAGSAVTPTAMAVRPTINQSGTAGYTAFDINPTETATGSGVKLLQRWAVGGSTAAQMNNFGNLWVTRFIGVQGSGFAASMAAPIDVVMERDAAQVLAQRNGTNAQIFRVYNTYTDGSNNERAEIAWSSNSVYIQTTQVGTGVARAMLIGTTGGASLHVRTNGASRWEFNSSGHLLASTDNTYDIGNSGGTGRPKNIYIAGSLVASSGSVIVGSSTVAGLPSVGVGTHGHRFVTDSTVAAAGNFGNVVVGGGANVVPVYSDGTNWRIG